MNALKLAVVLLFSLYFGSCTRPENDEIKIRNIARDTSDSYEGRDSETAGSKGGNVVSSREAIKHIGDSLTIRGFVADVFQSGKVNYLNFENKFPRNVFTCTVFAGSAPRFGELSRFKGKNVEVTGKITSFRNKPQMILWTEAQIKILE